MKRLLLTLLILAMAIPAYAISVDLAPIRDITDQECKNNDLLVRTGSAIVYGAVLSSASAGDRIDIYDAVSKTGNPILEIEVGVANSTEIFEITRGIKFNTGIYVDATDAETNYTILYNDD